MAPAFPHVGTAAITENMLKRRWSATILRHLHTGLNNPADIVQREHLLSSKVLTERLRTMLRYGLVQRFPHPAPSLVIEYRLTPLGLRILEMLNAIDQLEIDMQNGVSLGSGSMIQTPSLNSRPGDPGAGSNAKGPSK